MRKSAAVGADGVTKEQYGVVVAILAFSFQRPAFRFITSDDFTHVEQLWRSRWTFFWY